VPNLNRSRHLKLWLAPALAAGLLMAGCSKTDPTTTAGAGGSSSTAAPSTTASAKASTTTTGDDDSDSTTTTKAAGGGDYGKGGAGTTTTVGGVPANGVVVNKATSSFGDITVDGKGMTLYAFKNDTGSESTCTGGCPTAWPPFVGPVESAGDGIQLASMGTTTRADGTRQVTYKGHPLYHFSGDEKPGDTNGQGIGGIWWAMGADGTPTTKK
jgi:predicted lipoprotein with Yx(FWY)xxD motif